MGYIHKSVLFLDVKFFKPSSHTCTENNGCFGNKGHAAFDPMGCLLYLLIFFAEKIHQSTIIFTVSSTCCWILAGTSRSLYCWSLNWGINPASRIACWIPSAVKRNGAPAAETTFSSIMILPISSAPE